MASISDHILHNDHHLVIVNKEAGVPCAKNANGKSGVIEWVQAYTKRNLFLVNRIDTPVSGLLVLAKTKEAAKFLSQQFGERTIKKCYLAVTRKRSEIDEGTWSDHLAKQAKTNRSQVTEKGGKPAITRFSWVESLDHLHLYLLKPETGRHHQLRVHMSAYLAPIRGDQKYGDKRGNPDRSIDLHAVGLKLVHPSTKQELEFFAPIPSKPPWTYFEKINDKDYVKGVFKN